LTVTKEQPQDLIDETIHQRTRLAIMATLAGVDRMGFVELKAHLGLTDGNLSVHLSALEKPGYVRVTKSFENKKPLTTVAMTPKGRAALNRYIAVLQKILQPPA
jgi:DNA-binding MarR family transcriptional regulator